MRSQQCPVLVTAPLGALSLSSTCFQNDVKVREKYWTPIKKLYSFCCVTEEVSLPALGKKNCSLPPGSNSPANIFQSETHEKCGTWYVWKRGWCRASPAGLRYSRRETSRLSGEATGMFYWLTWKSMFWLSRSGSTLQGRANVYLSHLYQNSRLFYFFCSPTCHWFQLSVLHSPLIVHGFRHARWMSACRDRRQTSGQQALCHVVQMSNRCCMIFSEEKALVAVFFFAQNTHCAHNEMARMHWMRFYKLNLQLQ